MENCNKCQKTNTTCATCTYDEMKYCKYCKLTGIAVDNFDRYITHCKTCTLGTTLAVTKIGKKEDVLQNKTQSKEKIPKTDGSNTMIAKILVIQKLHREVLEEFQKFLYGHAVKIIKQKGYDIDEENIEYTVLDVSLYIIDEAEIRYEDNGYEGDARKLAADLQKYINKKYPDIIKHGISI